MADINLIPTEYKKKGINLGANFSKVVGIILALLILSLLVYGGLFIYKKNLTQKVDDLNKSISDLESKRDNKLENSIYDADKKLNAVEALFKDHFYWSKLFAIIEQVVVPDVYFTEAKIALADSKVNLILSGNAATYTSLARQMVSFKEDALVESVDLGEVKLSESGGINFVLTISASKVILINQIENTP